MDQGELALTDREFARIQQRLYRGAGISLSDAKRTLVMSRLFKLVRALGLRSFDDYVDYLERRGTPQDAQAFVNALTTNLTRFYREDHHFEHLQPACRDAGREPAAVRGRVAGRGCASGRRAARPGRSPTPSR